LLITGRYERDYIGLNIEIDPGYDKFIQSADPKIQAQFMAARQGDLLWVTNGGKSIRVLTMKVIEAAPPPVLSVAVDNTVTEYQAA
jgi:acetyl/propionyl-CoA carboxylase alpha subunit